MVSFVIGPAIALRLGFRRWTIAVEDSLDLVQGLDKNESLTIVEVMNAKIVEFQNADSNGDGELTIKEFSEFERRR